MKLLLSVPEVLLLDMNDVRQIIVETGIGSLGILPNRLDCVAALMPGVMRIDDQAGKRHYIAVDVGILVKRAETVEISVRHAVQGEDLSQLQSAVENLLTQREREDRDARVVLARLEGNLLRHFARGGRGGINASSS